jgi:hypothetical protein
VVSSVRGPFFFGSFPSFFLSFFAPRILIFPPE